ARVHRLDRGADGAARAVDRAPVRPGACRGDRTDRRASGHVRAKRQARRLTPSPRKTNGGAAAPPSSWPGSRDQRSCSTTTDLAGSSTSKVLPDTVAPLKATGLTCSGCSKVLCAVIALPVSTLPDTEPACSPETLAETLAGLSGSRLDSATYTCPSFARTPEPCTAGPEVSPRSAAHTPERRS